MRTYNKTGAVTICAHCGTETMTHRSRRSLPASERDRYGERVTRDGTCSRCYDRIRNGSAPGPRIEVEPIAYEGGWVNRGGVLYPTKPARGAA